MSGSSATASDGTTKKKNTPVDLIHRGVYRSTPAGTATFIGLRTADLYIQYQILRNGLGSSLIHRAGGHVMPLFHFGPPLALELPLPHLLLLGMAAGSTIKQLFWLTVVSREEFPAGPAAIVSVYNTFVNSTNSLLLVTAATSAALARGPAIEGRYGRVTLPVAVGVVLYVVGMGIETISEIQRKRFKEAPKNEGKICDEGLFGVARHANYAGYTLWRMGYCLAGGGWIAGAVMGAWQAWNFVGRSIVVMDDYMGGKYGTKWEQYKKNVPWMLFPGIY